MLKYIIKNNESFRVRVNCQCHGHGAFQADDSEALFSSG